ncbi:MAG TPA: biopolymer transporter ExbD [Candidatus Marinimicrobia bacterium]|jgi:biopolymer transport protein ExbD|uniref:Biopolymer transporter ExbD n=1 Tax=marine metagenome TaxID=408172 RepID=A0A382GXD4_9ZZZZ|nr:biopolymer transporter ExbD [Candidatus Neomarinimicrobiota bacterium]MDP7026808.1 biopolymer transporter ExbD [Candidatus Neomarinimicrobiota bacterium]HJM84413.1 biopolymer transporter ExbD [Candidatus Neomarinimicrobiota bacterium]|tara:strand:- start:77 stop:487 length:411 start_codon:yes stop_codon:yes gene_type:complete
MKIERKTHTSKEISTSSMPDIIFMLLIFFMVTTVMREYEGLDIIMPRAKMIEKLESKRHTSYVWATKDGLVSVDDRIININNLSGLMYNKIAKDPKITVSLKSDEKTTMKLITDIHTQLRTANALKLSYSALTKAP